MKGKRGRRATRRREKSSRNGARHANGVVRGAVSPSRAGAPRAPRRPRRSTFRLPPPRASRRLPRASLCASSSRSSPARGCGRTTRRRPSPAAPAAAPPRRRLGRRTTAARSASSRSRARFSPLWRSARMSTMSHSSGDAGRSLFGLLLRIVVVVVDLRVDVKLRRRSARSTQRRRRERHRLRDHPRSARARRRRIRHRRRRRRRRVVLFAALRVVRRRDGRRSRVFLLPLLAQIRASPRRPEHAERRVHRHEISQRVTRARAAVRLAPPRRRRARSSPRRAS